MERKKTNSISTTSDIEDAKIVIQNNTTFSWNGIGCLVGGGMVHFCFGSLYAWSNFYYYCPINLRSDFVFPLTIVCQCMTMPLSPILTARYGARVTLLFGSLLMASGVYLSSFQRTKTMFVICYSLMFGAGVGISYQSPMIAGWKWLPENKGP